MAEQQDRASEARASAIRAAVQKYLEILVEYGSGERMAAQGTAMLEEGQARQKAAHEQFAQLLGMATLFSFDLQSEFNEEMHRQAQFQDVQPPPANLEMMPAAIDPPKRTVKDHVADAAQRAYPNPVRASALRQQLASLGITVHEKTVGMTLYRLLKEGVVTRVGRDWFFVPNGKRPAAGVSGEEGPRDELGLFRDAAE